MRWRWMSSGSYLNISKYFEHFLIFQVVGCTLGGARRALDRFHILLNILDKMFSQNEVALDELWIISEYFQIF